MNERPLKLMCVLHGERPAATACVVCGLPVCDECGTRKEHEPWTCPDHGAFVQEWKMVSSHQDGFAADAVLRNLQLNDIEGRLFEQASMVDDRPLDAALPARVWVRNENAETASALIAALDLHDL